HLLPNSWTCSGPMVAMAPAGPEFIWPPIWAMLLMLPALGAMETLRFIALPLYTLLPFDCCGNMLGKERGRGHKCHSFARISGLSCTCTSMSIYIFFMFFLN
uniref:Uncharacterized protein n=1 Tax=Electrophorus electricus TaxID=8005 RepID=A0A4W4E9G9_ELEEL